MDPLIALCIVLNAAGAGLLGSLLGLGGGIIIVPALTLLFGYPMQEAIGASLVAVIATSTGSASYYVEEGVSNVRLGLILGVVTSLGGLVGALIAVYTDQYVLALLFGLVLLYTAFYPYRSCRTGHTEGCGFPWSCSRANGPHLGPCPLAPIVHLGHLAVHDNDADHDLWRKGIFCGSLPLR